ncbi:MAG: hypothetical protein ACRDS0_08585 [Pseudonocardiaceae bacterium]
MYLGKEVATRLRPAPLVDAAGVDHDGAVALLGAIFADLPNLDEAACIGRHELFDPIRAARGVAVNLRVSAPINPVTAV